MSCEILYNESSQCIVVVETLRLSTNLWTKELRFRHISDSKYILVPRTEKIYRGVTSCPYAPAVLFSVWEPDGGGGQDWHSIVRLELPSGELKTISTAEDFPASHGYVEAWPNALISARGTGDSAICSVGLKRQIASNSFVVDYWLSEVNFKDRRLQLLSSLADVVV